MNKRQQREALRLGLERAIETANDSAWQQRMRELRAENMRRTESAA